MKNKVAYFFHPAAVVCTIIYLCSGVLFAQAIPVTLSKDNAGNWQLYRGGEPYYIKGVGGSQNLDYAAAIGANSMRTWSTDNAQEILDKAHALGLTVMMGLWVQH
ncbi:MAG: hypothetical protein ACK4IY_03435, partial [Chitinophagales bacterium]